MTTKTKNVTHQEHNNLLGIAFMLVNAIAITIIYAFIKDLTKEVSSNMVVFLYKAIILVSIIPWCLYGGLATMKTQRIFLHMSRGFLSASASLCLYYALKHIAMGDIIAVGYLEQVLWAVIGIIVFNERMSASKFISIALSFIGAMVVMYHEQFWLALSGSEEFYNSVKDAGFNHYYIFVFLSIVLWAINSTLVKISGKTEKTKVHLFYGMFFQVMLATPFAFIEWQETLVMGIRVKEPMGLINLDETGLKFSHIGMLLILASCYFAHTVAFFKSLKNAEFSVVVPFDYSRILFGALIGWQFFDEEITLLKIIGYCLIAGAGVYLICAEARHKKRLHRAKIQQLEEEFEHA